MVDRISAKPMISVGFNTGDESSLVGHLALAWVDASNFFHGIRGMRAPLGIYNASLSRVCPRVSRYCADIEPLFRDVHIDPQREGSAGRARIAESLEAMLYAAAEHVDDMENLASGFFKTHPLAKKDSRYREFLNRIGKCKKLTSTMANKVKHEQARICLYALEVRHGGIPASLHGFIVEGANEGVIGPHRVVHSVHPVLSLTTIAWEVLDFLVIASMALARFLTHFPKLPNERPSVQSPQFSEAVRAAARLPTYTFGEPHPFSRTTFRLVKSEDSDHELDSGIYGSILARWSHSTAMEYGSFAMTTEGDGTSRSFAVVSPSKVSLVHWT